MAAGPFTLAALAERIGAAFDGDPSLELHAVAPIETAGAGDLSFVANKRYERHLETTAASAVIVAEAMAVPRAGLAVLRMKDPYEGFVRALLAFHPLERTHAPGIDAAAVVHPTARIGTDVTLGACVVVGERAVIGDRTVVLAGTVVGKDVRIGADCLVHPNVSVLDGSELGARVIVHAGTTIGSDGFGFAPVGGGWMKIPQTGTVVIEDDVEIGANTTIDRATLGITRVRRGTKIDNLSQIAHNVDVGEDCIIVSQTGISGSTTLGRHVVLAGQVGVVGHITIGDDVTITAQSGVSKSIEDSAGKVFRGSPAREIHEELRQEAAIRRLPDLLATVRTLETRIAELEARLALHDAEQPAG